MTTLLITRGLPGCGKSTLADVWVRLDSANRVLAGRDRFRLLLHGRRLGTARQEEQVTIAQHATVLALLLSGVSVAADDTNLEAEHFEGLRQLAVEAGAVVQVEDLRGVPLDVCLGRNARRSGDARVPDAVVRGMWADHIRPLLPLPLT